MSETDRLKESIYKDRIWIENNFRRHFKETLRDIYIDIVNTAI